MFVKFALASFSPFILNRGHLSKPLFHESVDGVKPHALSSVHRTFLNGKGRKDSLGPSSTLSVQSLQLSPPLLQGTEDAENI